MMKRFPAFAAALLCAACSCPSGNSPLECEGHFTLAQQGGPTLGYAGCTLLYDGDFAFKDLDRDGELDPYEDWRLSPEERAADLAGKLSIEEIAGLMLYSSHQRVPATWQGTYDGKKFEDSGAAVSDLTDQQKKFLEQDNLRAVLVTGVRSPADAARWNNNMQSFVEGLGHGIPVNTSSDPRNQASSDKEFYVGGGAISLWPSSLGMAATFDPSLVEEFGRIASQEYRALGIATALSPQVDIATEPRWWRFSGTFGEDPDLSTDMARAYCDGFQTSPEGLAVDGAWGLQSVNAMVKHWYGYGAQEAGRDSHFAHGKFAVYPGGNLAEHQRPFTEGAFKLTGGTGCASAVMPIYSVLWNQDPSGDNVGGAYSYYLIQNQLREQSGFGGVVCTDWGITGDNTAMDYTGGGKPWGVEELSVAERHYRILMCGVDQFGGNDDKGPVLEAYRMWERDFGPEAARERFEQSARRLLLNIFRVGLFENPYLDPAESEAVVGNAEFMARGFEAQRKSVVMLKNHDDALPVRERAKVYLPARLYPATPGIWGGMSEERRERMIPASAIEEYFDVVSDPSEADFAIVGIKEPSVTMGYDLADVEEGGNGYVPMSLQYEDYKAVTARAESIAGGDPLEDFVNRSYRGKKVSTRNRADLDLVRETRKAMGDKPVVVVLETGRPVVLSEIEPLADAILLSFEVQGKAIADIVSGAFEPSGLLPMQMPASMAAVEAQLEDVPRDLRCYRDADSNVYDFAFGLDWSGVIRDERVQKYY